MPCYHPIQGYRARHVNESGKRGIVFNAKDGYTDMPIKVPCGRCIGCRLEYSRQWAIRCVHEAQMHDNNSFLTLTYNNKNLPLNKSLEKDVIPKFIRRLRKRLKKKYGPDFSIRYFACGEYGEQKNRPHYHLILFGYDFPDKEVWAVKNGNVYYRSKELEQLWLFGFSTIGEVTFESAAYVARYITKKWKKDPRDEETQINMANAVVDRFTGEIYEVMPEFCLMSRKPGIGSTWLDMYHGDTDKDFITIDGKVMSLPKYYDRLMELEDPHAMLKRKGKRIRKAKEKEHDNTTERLYVKEKVKEAQISFLKREMVNTDDY